MTDPITPTPPIIVNASPANAIMGTVAGALLILVTGFPTLLLLLKARDIAAIIEWVRGSDGVAFVSAASLCGTIAWRVISSWRKHARTVIAAADASDSVAIVKGATP